MEYNWHKNNACMRTLLANNGRCGAGRKPSTPWAPARATTNAAAAPPLADFQVLILLWGGRKNETLTLEWRDMDFRVKTVRFRANATKSRTEQSKCALAGNLFHSGVSSWT